LRQRQKEQTGTLILEAVARILARRDVSAATMAEVAREAGITERTIYRHYTTREDLLVAFWRWQLEQSGGQNVLTPTPTIPALLDSIRHFFANLDAQEGVIRAIMASPEGRAIRHEANQRRLAHMCAFLAPLIPHIPESEQHRIASGVISLSSVLSWLFMRDTCGYDGKQAGEAVALTVELILQAAQARSDALASRKEFP
jgi:AcrR family transcriptional regulator